MEFKCSELVFPTTLAKLLLSFELGCRPLPALARFQTLHVLLGHDWDALGTWIALVKHDNDSC